MFDLYVYYKVRCEHAARLEPLVRAMQAALGEHREVAAQLKRRPEMTDGLQTWMEVYAGVDAAFGEVLDAAARGAGLASLIEGPRHAEVFTDLTPCA
ncbi:DUF4936 family protein [Massilia horti]|uniref:DUF4936 family protein n=1 Tax=Massilia horti TaxID=2562153 RepID=A0A4Y9SQC3_9BURK|nr:DUF4936 family protein [Massilia horti]TFW28962.1 DUF4936 family protein [Massilia horti]